VREPAEPREDRLSFATLNSPLARNQAQAVIDRLQQRARGLACELDLLESPQPEAERARETFVALSRAEVAFLVQALNEGRTRLLVLEAADLLGAGLTEANVVCVPDRAAPFDAFLNRGGLIMDEMAAGARIGVLSQRVRAQLAALWPDLRFRVLHGGVDRAMETHLRRSEIDGLVLPASATEHLGIQGIVAEIFAPEFVLPGPGQGTLVVLARDDDEAARVLLAPLHSEDSAVELAAEAAFHRRMLPDQDLPVAALASVDADGLAIMGATGAGRQRISVSGTPAEAEAVGDGLAMQILGRSDTFADLLEADYQEGHAGQADEDAALLDEIAADEGEAAYDHELDDLDDLRGFEDLAGFGDDDESDEPDPEGYDDER